MLKAVKSMWFYDVHVYCSFMMNMYIVVYLISLLAKCSDKTDAYGGILKGDYGSKCSMTEKPKR